MYVNKEEFEPKPLYIEAPMPSELPKEKKPENKEERGVFIIDMGGEVDEQ